MGELRTTNAMRINENTDEARTVARYAAAWSLDLFDLSITAHRVTAHVGNVDHAQRLAAGFNLNNSQVFTHTHNGQASCHTRWSDPSTHVQVVNVSRAVPVERAS